MDFTSFPKITRYSRPVVVTEKIDGTNAQVVIVEGEGLDDPNSIAAVSNLVLFAGSRTRWITPRDDNFGFAAWVEENSVELAKLGPGRHFGEWWGCGIQRRYGLSEKRFSLFNVSRWLDDDVRPACCHVVPVLYEGALNDSGIDYALNHLKIHGSQAAPGFMRPEGIVIYHIAANTFFKKTLEKDDQPKGART